MSRWGTRVPVIGPQAIYLTLPPRFSKRKENKKQKLVHCLLAGEAGEVQKRLHRLHTALPPFTKKWTLRAELRLLTKASNSVSCTLSFMFFDCSLVLNVADFVQKDFSSPVTCWLWNSHSQGTVGLLDTPVHTVLPPPCTHFTKWAGILACWLESAPPDDPEHSEGLRPAITWNSQLRDNHTHIFMFPFQVKLE